MLRLSGTGVNVIRRKAITEAPRSQAALGPGRRRSHALRMWPEAIEERGGDERGSTVCPGPSPAPHPTTPSSIATATAVDRTWRETGMADEEARIVSEIVARVQRPRCLAHPARAAIEDLPLNGSRTQPSRAGPDLILVDLGHERLPFSPGPASSRPRWAREPSSAAAASAPAGRTSSRPRRQREWWCSAQGAARRSVRRRPAFVVRRISRPSSGPARAKRNSLRATGGGHSTADDCSRFQRSRSAAVASRRPSGVAAPAPNLSRR